MDELVVVNVSDFSDVEVGVEDKEEDPEVPVGPSEVSLTVGLAGLVGLSRVVVPLSVLRSPRAGISGMTLLEKSCS
jgi:hypothetical protein